MKPMTVSDTNSAVDNMANYYRTSRLYTSHFNMDDVYHRYIEEYTADTEKLIQRGFSYKLKDEYLVAVDIEQLAHDDPALFEHYFGPISKWLGPYVEREISDVLYICAVGPSTGFFNSTTYKLIKEFTDKFSKDYTILTDCPVEIDIESFARKSGSRKVIIAGAEYFRWGCRKE